MNEEEHVKEVYARFGLAFYYAQLLEQGVINAMIVVHLIPTKRSEMKNASEWAALVDDFLERQSDHTMGRLFRELRGFTTVPEDLDEQFRLALENRNRLAHGFFRENAEQFMTPTGRDAMLTDLHECTDLFATADRRLGEIVDPMRRRAGLTDEMVAKAYEDYLRTVRHGA